jgi:hypothetical protein
LNGRITVLSANKEVAISESCLLYQKILRSVLASFFQRFSILNSSVQAARHLTRSPRRLQETTTVVKVQSKQSFIFSNHSINWFRESKMVVFQFIKTLHDNL